MGRISFENYGKRAKILKDYTCIAGRFSLQKDAEKNILPDIVKKLTFNSNDNCLCASLTTRFTDWQHKGKYPY